MTQGDASFSGSIPELYELGRCSSRLMPTTSRLARGLIGGRRVLEIAAGTGIVTRALAQALPEAEHEATDLNEAMVSFAAARAGYAVRWSGTDAMALPFDNSRFDLAVCQFGVMFFPDRLRAFREARRVLAPGGTYLFNVWYGLEDNDVARIVTEAVAAAFPDDPPMFLRRTPYGHGDPAAIERDLRDAGFTHNTYVSVAKRSRVSARDGAVSFCQGSPLHHEIMTRDPHRLNAVLDAATRALGAELGVGTIDGAMRAYVFTAR